MHNSSKVPKFTILFGLRVSPAGYAAYLALILTVISMIVMWKLEIPWWAWLGQFVVLFLIELGLIRFNSQPDADGPLEITNRKQLLTFCWRGRNNPVCCGFGDYVMVTGQRFSKGLRSRKPRRALAAFSKPPCFRKTAAAPGCFQQGSTVLEKSQRP